MINQYFVIKYDFYKLSFIIKSTISLSFSNKPLNETLNTPLNETLNNPLNKPLNDHMYHHHGNTVILSTHARHVGTRFYC